MIKKDKIKKFDDLRIYYSYTGEWINSGSIVSIYSIYNPGFTDFNYNIMRYTELDYYVMNRTTIFAQAGIYLKDVKPIFTLSYRGFIQAWIYRGDQLKNKELKCKEK